MRKWLLLWLLALAVPALANESLYVMCANHVVVMDPTTMNITATIPCKGAPAAIFANPARTHIYMVDGTRELIEILDVPTQKVTRTLTFSSKPDALPRLRAFIWGLSTDPQEKLLYAYITPSVRERETLRMDPPYVAVFDLASGKLVTKVPALPGVTSMAPSTDGSAIYLVGRDVYALDTRTNKIRLQVAVRHPEVQGEGEADYVVEWLHHRESGEVGSGGYFVEDPPTKRSFVGIMNLDLATGKLDKIEVGLGPDSFVPFSAIVSPDHKRGYMIFSNLMTIDLVERRMLSLVRLPHSYGDITENAAGTRLYAAGSGSSVLEYDTVENKVVREVELPYDTFEIMMVP